MQHATASSLTRLFKIYPFLEEVAFWKMSFVLTTVMNIHSGYSDVCSMRYYNHSYYLLNSERRFLKTC